MHAYKITICVTIHLLTLSWINGKFICGDLIEYVAAFGVLLCNNYNLKVVWTKLSVRMKSDKP